ncbi:MFS transporter [Burkholderia gladioli pv. gladioli]|uniref:MFS transporter n=1 Tax=Burkholderia gladioli TaxID=28095 RepID=A0A095HC21_BURGA|nr:MFS transporter [Burkholderia gladioli]AJW98651.1 sugar (and other) transporter family protein [Burkholderia gladioli]ASD79935.1 MFS transporter [Burkholderia gladioli pv. gladioli]AWY54821.1 MFS transporter [Burkholderia gladioli pv. gladioli]KGC11084.1 sugar (and other) transporter family protein [Burkholderia gladioli]MDJ1164182.1 MFS transporter [Burkholderia gladioli pv. gladioli]
MQEEAIDVHEELASASIGKTHISLGVILTLLTMFDGYDTFSPAYVIHYIREPWSLLLQQAGMLVSSGLIGFLCGAALHGLIADRLGRRDTLISGLWITTVFSILTALFAGSFTTFCVLRVLTGLGLGVLLPLSTTYINELAPRRVANTFSLWGVALGWALGGAAAAIIGVFLTPITGWRGLYWVGSLSAFLIPLLYMYLPESPRFSLLRGRTDEIRVILAKLRPERADLYRVLPLLTPQISARATASSLISAHRRLSFSIWLTSFLSLFCIFGLSGWIPTLMQARGESFATSFAFGALMQIMSLVGGLVCGYIIDRRGAPRAWLSAWWLGGAVAVGGLVFFHGHLSNLIFCALTGFCVIGAQFMLNNFTAHSYHTDVRATAVGMELSVGRLGAILGPFISGSLQQVFQGQNMMLLAMSAAAAAAGISILFAVKTRSACSEPNEISSTNATVRTV